jgi:formiminotetrahydrofolate cyclodeaminase
MADAFRAFVDRVASAEAVPGGGSVAALAGSLGAALGQMAVGITKGKKNYQQHFQRYTEALDRLAACSATLLQLVDSDAEAYGQVMAAYKLPKDSPERDEAIQKRLVGATEIPSRTGNSAAEALRICEDMRPLIHPNVASDLEVGIHMLRASLQGAIANIRINLPGIKALDTRSHYEQTASNWEHMLKST